jgi:hypothetical protein
VFVQLKRGHREAGEDVKTTAVEWTGWMLEGGMTGHEGRIIGQQQAALCGLRCADAALLPAAATAVLLCKYNLCTTRCGYRCLKKPRNKMLAILKEPLHIM